MTDTCCAIKVSDEQLKCKSKTVLFVPIDSIGHINSLIGIADSLKERGHRTVFLFLDPINSELSRKGHEVYDCSTEELIASKMTNSTIENKREASGIFKNLDEIMRNNRTEAMVAWIKKVFAFHRENTKQKDAIFGRKLELIKPDVLILDQFQVQPSIYKYGKPWANIMSTSPLVLHPVEHNLPPCFIGLPTNWLQVEDEKLRREYQQKADIYRELYKDIALEWQEYLRVEHQIDTDGSLVPVSKHLNAYFYPKELDYGYSLENWHQCDSILRVNTMNDNHDAIVEVKKVFEIPAELMDKPGKLIFLSMGTLACKNVNLMKRLVDILSKCPHKFIVSMGPKADEYKLAPNMWGQKHVDQLAILQVIDMIITHGGNNTITECFYYGVPGFIVCPAFGDQMDNAQRIEECKLGKRVDPFNCTEQQFLGAIEEVLANRTIKPRMKAISERMQQPDSKYKAIKLFTQFVEAEYS